MKVKKKYSLTEAELDAAEAGVIVDLKEPYPNVHACRLEDPKKYDTCRTGDRVADKPDSVKGKKYQVIYCKKTGGSMEQQAFRYSIDTWTESQARSHCNLNDGSFEAAEKKESDIKGEGDIKNLLDGLISMKELGRILSHENEELIKKSIAVLNDLLDKLATGKEVENAERYNAIKEAKALLGNLKLKQMQSSIVPLAEKTVRADSTIPIKIIEPCWGTSGYYSKEVLQKCAEQYKAGTQMFWDHPTPTEESEKPERSLKDLASVLISEGRWQDDGIAGPGVYSDAKVFEPFKSRLEEIAEHIGLSHVAAGKARYGEAEGKKGMIVESIDKVLSVDYVTMSGAGGKVVQLFESVKGKKDMLLSEVDLTMLKKERPDLVETLRSELKDAIYNDKKEGKKMDDVKVKEVQDKLDAAEVKNKEKEKENAKLKETLVLIEAKKFVDGKLKEAEIPDITKERLAKDLSEKPIVKEDKLDEAEYEKKIKEAVDAEVAYLAKLSESGKIKGMGDGEVSEEDKKKAQEKLTEGFKKLGLTEEQAKSASQGRV